MLNMPIPVATLEVQAKILDAVGILYGSTTAPSMEYARLKFGYLMENIVT